MPNDNRLEVKVDKILENVSEINTHLAVYNEQLKEHIKRTNQLERRVIPIEKHVSMISGALKLVGLLAAVAAIVEIFVKAS